MADYTSVNVKNETWQRLNSRKQPGDSFDDVIQRLLESQDQTPESEVSA